MLRRIRGAVLDALVRLATGGDQSVVTPKDESVAILKMAETHAHALLNAQGIFYPFGVSARSKTEVALVSSTDRPEQPLSVSSVGSVRDAIRSEVAKGHFVAAAVVYIARVRPPGSGSETDVVAIELGHRDEEPRVVYFPYSTRNGRVKLTGPFSKKIVGELFRFNAS